MRWRLTLNVSRDDAGDGMGTVQTGQSFQTGQSSQFQRTAWPGRSGRTGRSSCRRGKRTRAQALCLGVLLSCGTLSDSAAAQKAEATPPSSLVSDTGAARFQMRLGRLVLDAPQHIKCRRTCESPCGRFHQTLRVSAERGVPSVHYVWTTPSRLVTLDVNEAEEVRIRSEWRGAGGVETLEIDQPRWEPVTVRWLDRQAGVDTDANVAESETDESWQTSSLVHLRAEYPRLFARHVAPLLVQIGCAAPPVCRPADLLAAMERQRLHSSFSEARVASLVEQLGARQRKSRVLAQRELLELGLPVLALIERMDFERLEAEQRSRLREIQKELSRVAGDSSEAMAQWLSVDLKYWRWAVAECSPAERASANRLLTATLGEGLPSQYRVAEGASSTLR